MPCFRYRDITFRMKKLGFVFHREAKGSHEVWIHKVKKQKIILIRKRGDYATGTALAIAKKCGFSSLKDFESFS